MTLQDAIENFNMMCTDTLDDANDTFMEAVCQMAKRKLPIPAKYQFELPKRYTPGKEVSDATVDECYCHDDFEKASDEVISEIAEHFYNVCLEESKKKYGKVKWCHTLGCNKKATKFTDKLTDVHPNELRYIGYCEGHYIRAIKNCR